MMTKAIKSGKEHRHEYIGVKAISKANRNHGSDPYSRDNRLHQRKAAEARAKADMDEIR